MPSTTLAQRIKDVLGVSSMLTTSRDVHLLLLTRFVRMCAYGSSTLVLALYFAALGHSDTKIGLFLSLTLVGEVGISLLLTLVADSLGRRRILIAGGLLMALSGVVFATTSNYWLLLLAAVVGVISPSGNEIGPFRAIEESTLAQLSDSKTRTDVFAFYVVVGTLGGPAVLWRVDGSLRLCRAVAGPTWPLFDSSSGFMLGWDSARQVSLCSSARNAKRCLRQFRLQLDLRRPRLSFPRTTQLQLHRRLKSAR
jgi:MFS family permease